MSVYMHVNIHILYIYIYILCMYVCEGLIRV